MSRKISLQEPIDFLKKTDPILNQIIQQVGPLQLERQNTYFLSLVKAIIYQQLAGKAAESIFNRFQELYEGRSPEPVDILSTADEKFRAAGLSKQKLSYLKDLALKFSDGTLAQKRWNRMSDEEIIQHLIQIKGIGRWTAEMFLIFSLGRLDVLPVDDLGLRKAAQKAYQLQELPQAETIKKLAEPWKPYRTVATLYLWRSLHRKEEG